MEERVVIHTCVYDNIIKIEQTIYYDYSEYNPRYSEFKVDTGNEQVREALIKLGWTPPDDIESRVCENCKYLEYGTFDNTLYCSIDCSSNQYRREKTVTKDFGCNLFERKVES